MSVLTEKVAYLRGLAKGLNIDNGSEQNKIINAIIDALDEFAEEFDRMDDLQAKMQEEIDIIDEDLGNLEEEVYEGEYDDDLIEVSCPNCNEIITFSEDEIDDNNEVECPVCHKNFEIEWECDCECDCDECHTDNDK